MEIPCLLWNFFLLIKLLARMGAHHFTLYMVRSGARPVRNPDGTYDSSFLLGFALSETVLGRLRLLLPRPNHWGPVEEFCSSAEWGSDLRIWHEDSGEVCDVVLRYAPGSDPVHLLEAFAAIAMDAGCELLVQTTFEVIPAKFECVLQVLRNHRAFRFLSDPEGVIKEAASETNQNC